MGQQEANKFGQSLQVVDGRNVYTIPAASAGYEWKFTPGTPTLIWTDADYDVLPECHQIIFDDLTVSVDSSGQIDIQHHEQPEPEPEQPVNTDNQVSAPETAGHESITIHINDFLNIPVEDKPFISKAWANNGRVEILSDSNLSYLPHPDSDGRDEVTFVVEDEDWSTQVLKIRIENNAPIQELGSQLIPDQFDGLDAQVNLDIGGYLSDLLIDGHSSVSVAGLPPDLLYNAGRMHIEGSIVEDGSEGQSHSVQISITTAKGQVLTTRFKWTIQQEKAFDNKDTMPRIVPQIGSQNDAAAAAVLYSVASQAGLAAQSFALAQKPGAGQANSNAEAGAFKLAQIDALAGGTGASGLSGEEGQDLLDLAINNPVMPEEEDELQESLPTFGLSGGGASDAASTSARPDVDLDEEATNNTSILAPISVNQAPFAGTPTAVGTSEDTVLTDIDVLSAAYDPDGDPLSVRGASAENGTVVINNNGVLEYTPDADYFGADVIEYSLMDDKGNVTQGSVSVTVFPVNDAPIAGSPPRVSPQKTWN